MTALSRGTKKEAGARQAGGERGKGRGGQEGGDGGNRFRVEEERGKE